MSEYTSKLRRALDVLMDDPRPAIEIREEREPITSGEALYLINALNNMRDSAVDFDRSELRHRIRKKLQAIVDAD